MKVLVSDKLAKEGLDILKAAKGIEVIDRPGLPLDELKKAIADVDGIIIRSATKVTADLIAAAKRLKAIARAGAGVDNVDLEAASRRGIIVMNTPGGNTISAAEQALAMLFALARNTPAADASMKQQVWEKKKYTGTELTAKTLGIVGLGRIGSEVARRALGLRMNVIGFDPFLDAERARTVGIEMTDSIEELLKKSHYVTVHAALTDKTRGMIGKKELAAARDGIVIINCARGGIVDEQALLDALESGKVGGAGLDVFTSEPPADWTLAKHPRVVATPHLGASTEEAQINVAVAAAEQMVDALINNKVRFAVNFPSIEPEQMAALEPYLVLGRRLGAIASQLSKGAVKEVTVAYSGEVALQKTEAVTAAVAVGLLSSYVEDVNMVNAGLLLKERGVIVKETRSSTAEEFVTYMSVEARSGDERHGVGGTLFGKSGPRLVLADGFELEVEPAGTILFIRNKDVPGVIGEVGRILGAHQLNIGSLNNGRKSVGGEALTVVTVDTDPAPAVIQELTRVPSIVDVRVVRLEK
jgi:D-3-phosphoglycerate dehydrogenase